MLKVKCSGAFRHNNELVDFTDVELIMPDCPKDWIKSNAINRCFVMQAEKKFNKRIDSIHSLYVDKVEEFKKVKADGKDVPALPSCAGKKIKELTWEELQDFAVMFCLRSVPLFRSCDLRTARAIAYRAYVNEITGGELDEDYDFFAAADIICPETASKYAVYQTNVDKIMKGEDIIKDNNKKESNS